MEKNANEILAEQLLCKKSDGYTDADTALKKNITEFCEDYKKFLDACKTERECTEFLEKEAKKEGFKALSEYTRLAPGDRVYLKNTDKSILLAVIGKKDLAEGVNIVAAHIDSPRLDTKQNPLYEDGGLAYFKTHYYGGIKKYQWLAMPLAIHGTVVKKGGEKINIVIGEDESDPVFCISDLLPHLAVSQMSKTGSKLIEGEKLNVILGSVPIEGEKVADGIKLNVMKLLNESFGITESDFVSADIEIVPAFKARDVGFDRSLIGAYGHDDRVCAYTAFRAILEAKTPETTAVCHLVDKEETGSSDSTGMKSRFFENTLAKFCFMTTDNYNDIMVRDALTNSRCLSADVSAAVDPNFAEVCEKNNSAYLNYGVALMKYSGSRGKSGTSEAQAEFVRCVTDIFDENGVKWQTCELGKVDEGGGGTVAQYLAVLNMNVIDCGVPLLSMHAPFELASKFDVYSAHSAYKAFYNA